MYDIYLVFSSVTYALKAMSCLKKNGVTSRLEKIKSIPSLGGCGYALAVKHEVKDETLRLLNESRINVIEILESKDGAV